MYAANIFVYRISPLNVRLRKKAPPPLNIGPKGQNDKFFPAAINGQGILLFKKTQDIIR